VRQLENDGWNHHSRNRDWAYGGIWDVFKKNGYFAMVVLYLKIMIHI
jgi:hypothetical protein